MCGVALTLKVLIVLCDRKVNTRGSGVLLYVKHGLGAVQVNVNTEFPEHVWCRLNIKVFNSSV